MSKQLCLAVAAIFVPFLAGGAPLQAATARQSIPLNSNWEFRQRAQGAGAQEAVWRPAQVPGTVHTDLLQNKLIPDPFYRDNEAKLQWIEDANWEYRSAIQATPDVLAHRSIELVFEGLDAYADVYLNGQLVLTADNAFLEWRVDVKPLLRPGANPLLVVFPSPIQAAAKAAASDKWRATTHTQEKTYIRKAAYEWGWDWGPRFVTSGIWRPVRLDVWDEARISDLHIRQRDVSAEVAHLTAEVEVTAARNGAATVTIDYVQNGDKGGASRRVEFRAGVNHIDFPIEIGKPALWYPSGYGKQALCNFHARVQVGSRSEDEATVSTGLRSVVLRRELDKWGRSFEFVVNGIPVFAKGADVIPFDSFPTRVGTEQYRQVLQSAKDANMNMIRHWGGGYYETEEFYAMCDELGLMIWQDFMFGNDWQPGTYAFKQMAAREAEFQVRRLRNHPSIVLWCGNNETESAYQWNRNHAAPEARLRMWEDYLTLFSGIVARAVERLSPEIPYWPSSASADYEEVSNEYQSGDYHNWDIWHGPMLPFRGYEKFFPRFVSEYGFQSFPDMRTVEAFTTPADRVSISTPVMMAHQKNESSNGNEKIRDYMLRDYPEPRDFASFLYVSQVLQAEGIKIGAEHLRRIRPRSMGSLYWQLNDCWPVTSWSSLDYYGRWKALQYYARRFYNDLLVSPHDENGNLAVYVVSDRTEPVAGELRIRLMKFDGSVLSDKSQTIRVPALSSQIYLQAPKAELLRAADATQVFAVAELSVAGLPVSSNLLYLVPTKQIHLPAAQITSELTRSGESWRLRVSSKVLARGVYIAFGNLPAKLSDNYFDLLPGQPVEITINSAAPAEELQRNLKAISLVDAFPDAQAVASRLQ